MDNAVGVIFDGKSVPGFNVTAAKLPYDPRWALFFTPHSAHLDPDLLRQAKTTVYWDTSPALRSPRQIQEGAFYATDLSADEEALRTKQVGGGRTQS